MNYQELLALIDKLDQSSLVYLDYRQGDQHVVLSKQGPAENEKAPATSDTSHPRTESSQQTTTGQAAVMDQENQSPSALISSGKPVKAPIVGVAYLSPSPEAPPFVKVGDRVEKGQTVCIIEAMKLMNEIVAPFTGTVQSIAVTNEAVVEFDQVLLTIAE